MEKIFHLSLIKLVMFTVVIVTETCLLACLYLVFFFHDTVLAVIHGRHVTVMPKDIRQLHGETDPYAGSISMRDVPKNIGRKRKCQQNTEEFGNNLY